MPASLPAACSGFGRPRTTTVVFADGPLCTIAPARFAARTASLRLPAEDAGEREVDAFQRAQHAGLQRCGRIPQRIDHLVGAFVALAPLADAAIDDLLQMIGAPRRADLGEAHARARVSFDQHAEQLSDLIHIVARLPARHGAREDVARRGQRVHRARGDAAAIALLPDDAEVAELQTASVADEHVQRREIAVERLSAMQLAQHFEDAGDLAPRRGFGPALARAREERAQVAVAGVLEREAVEDPSVAAHQREGVEHADRARMSVQQLAEVGFAQPAVDAAADLDAHRLRDDATSGRSAARGRPGRTRPHRGIARSGIAARFRGLAIDFRPESGGMPPRSALARRGADGARRARGAWFGITGRTISESDAIKPKRDKLRQPNRSYISV